MRNNEERRRVLRADGPLLTEVIVLHCLRWLGHVLHMLVRCLPFCTLFARVGQRWDK